MALPNSTALSGALAKASPGTSSQDSFLGLAVTTTSASFSPMAVGETSALPIGAGATPRPYSEAIAFSITLSGVPSGKLTISPLGALMGIAIIQSSQSWD